MSATARVTVTGVVPGAWQRLLDGAKELHKAKRLHGSPGEQMLYLRQMQGDLERVTAHTVKTAREAGDSWEKIGHALGMTKQGAQQRYGKKD